MHTAVNYLLFHFIYDLIAFLHVYLSNESYEDHETLQLGSVSDARKEPGAVEWARCLDSQLLTNRYSSVV